MALIEITEDDLIYFDPQVEPVVFWPYTTLVTGVVVRLYSKGYNQFRKYLIEMFREAGINAYEDNKIVFGVKDADSKIWYVGFKDFVLNIGTGVSPDADLKPITKTQ